MYEQQFGFSRPLFEDGIAQDEDVFRTEATARLTRDLAIALTRKDSVAIISGLSGTGKTTVAADSLRGLSTRLAFACVSHPPLTGQELLEQLLADFSFEPFAKSQVERLQIWRQFLSEMAATDTRVCLLVENVENLAPEVLRSLHSLTASDAAMTPGANVVLTTALATGRVLATEELHAFQQRVRLTARIEPLTREETAAYLRFKCAGADCESSSVFAPEFAARLFELSGGVIRIINNLLESALMSAADHHELRVSAERLTEAAEHFGMAQMSPREIDTLLVATPEVTHKETLTADNIPTLTDCISDSELAHVPARLEDDEYAPYTPIKVGSASD